MKIPEKLEALLEKDDGLCGSVKTALDAFGKWLEENRMVFFQGYPDHGIKHIEAVMHSAEALIRDEACKLLTASDSAACLLSILLHDCAMHLSEAGFRLMISNPPAWRPQSSEFSFEPAKWHELWHAFLREASRFDDQKLKDLFGEGAKAVEPPPDDPLHWTAQHELLIGEFLRRHHGTIAYEIALAGVPGPSADRLELPEMPDGMKDIIGLIAWSHCHPIRVAADRLETNGRKIWRNVHAPFLMGLLRIADYFQIDATRAAKEILLARHLHSPHSHIEWKKHEAIKDIRPHETDAECVFVDALPKDVKTFLALQRLLTDIQAELDATWALWGEVYGSDSKLCHLGITDRRIRSTLDDLASFEKKVDFIPVHARFKTADAELLKLMVGPLYSDNPSYGIRELIQNSVDACLEREDYEKQCGLTSLDLADLPADVVVTLEEEESGDGWLTVADRGIGMTSEVILDYFLTAGASYRSSEQWCELHAQGNEPRVTRSGRFGVGLLAAFLLGSEIEVTTRHVTQAQGKGIAFACKLEDREIQLCRIKRSIGIGTTIRIKLSQSMTSELVGSSNFEPCASWDWYAGRHPKLLRLLKLHRQRKFLPEISTEDEKLYELLPGDLVPFAGDNLPARWRRVSVPDFADVQWTWNRYQSAAVCNGIRIGNIDENLFGGGYNLWQWIVTECPLMASRCRAPLLNIFDSNGKFPINLTRTEVLRPLPGILDYTLKQAVCRDVLGFLLFRTPDSIDSCLDMFARSYVRDNSLSDKIEDLDHPGVWPPFNLGQFEWYWLAATSEGIVLTEPAILRLASPSPIFFVPRIGGTHPFLLEGSRTVLKSHPHGYMIAGFVLNQRDTDAVARWMYGALSAFTSPINIDTPFEHCPPFGPFPHFAVESLAILAAKGFWTDSLSQRFPSVVSRDVGQDMILVSSPSSESPAQWLDLDKLTQAFVPNQYYAVVFWRLGEPKAAELPTSPLGKMWKELFGQAVIPFDVKQRREQLAHAYRELAEEIKRWEQPETSDLWDHLRRDVRPYRTPHDSR